MPTDFDAKAATWDEDPSRVERARAVAEAVRKTTPLQPSTRMLEYGAGTGLLAEALVGSVGAITLAEPSAGMRAVLERKVASRAFPAGTRVWDLDLTADPVPAERFDLVVTLMTLHHIKELEPVLQGFAALLAGGGRLCVADLEEEDGSFHDPGFDGHHGFRRAVLTARLEEAGFTGVSFSPAYEVEKEGTAYPLFLAIAAGPA